MENDIYYLVRLPLPIGGCKRELDEYVRDALTNWHGQSQEGDNFFKYNWKRITVKRIK